MAAFQPSVGDRVKVWWHATELWYPARVKAEHIWDDGGRSVLIHFEGCKSKRYDQWMGERDHALAPWPSAISMKAACQNN